MSVVSRADLTQEKPAVEGTLVYKSTLSTDAIKAIVSRDVG